ncbi:helix-turn-helix domain-containing protein [Rhizobiaceae bacterium n13]|uniref:Helix-turn-helix domain-containing protein n=1 Tax=Ferirhizobium litorale TaxID=2927786 RepID=A0AAE3U1L3_9HYPH|nr:helix-turn-helix transcriptional regulator [Fererhizobium litorale]MDI7862171.1 helix-turn-helix domain-containing protein [Fererhizobium litorale]MDI7922556.1 helix-turn-helix domain-containing protein [Fererhizobium litorale]
MENPNFVENLRLACSTRRSVSQICREIGINRQQFNRYINGEARPSPHNLARIASAFGIGSEDFHLPQRQFRERLLQRAGKGVGHDNLLAGFPGDIAALRRHLGYYQTFHLSLSWPGKVISSCARLHEENGLVKVKSIERISDRANEIRQFSKYEGSATFSRNRIFIVEKSMDPQSIVAQTILMPFETHQRVYLKGVTIGVSWRKENTPYATRMIWRHLGSTTDLRALLENCGALPLGSRQLPAPVRSYLEDSAAVSAG